MNIYKEISKTLLTAKSNLGTAFFGSQFKTASYPTVSDNIGASLTKKRFRRKFIFLKQTILTTDTVFYKKWGRFSRKMVISFTFQVFIWIQVFLNSSIAGKFISSCSFLFTLMIFAVIPLELSFSWGLLDHRIFLLFNQICSVFFFLFETFSSLQSKKSNTQKIFNFLFELGAVVPFFWGDLDFIFVLYLFLKISFFFGVVNSYLKNKNLRISITLSLLSQALLLFHYISNSWLILLRFQEETETSWFQSLGLSHNKKTISYIYSLKWTFHVFFPLVSTPFMPNNEIESIFEILSIFIIGCYYLFNLDSFVFLFKKLFMKSQKKLESAEYLITLLNEIEKDKEGRENLICNVWSEINKKNKREDIKMNPLLGDFRSDFFDEFMKTIIRPILFEKFPFLYKNFSKEFLSKLVKICKLRRFNEGDLLLEVFRLNCLKRILFFRKTRWKIKNYLSFWKGMSCYFWNSWKKK